MLTVDDLFDAIELEELLNEEILDMESLIVHDTEWHEYAIIWALNVPIKGRGDAVQVARKVLVVLATRAGSVPGISWSFLLSICTVKQLSDQIGIGEQRIRRALERLEDQSLITREIGTSKTRIFRIKLEN